LQSTLAALLLVTAVVAFTAIVVDYAVVITEATLQTDLPPLERIKNLENVLLNQTDNLLNQTQSLPLESELPTQTPPPP
jgi:hypothetical protein